MKRRNLFLFYSAILFAIISSCSKKDTTIEDPASQVQPLNADTLFFSNETGFRDFLFHYGLSKKYTIAPPKYSNNCSVIPTPSIYPSQLQDDYLNESRFTSKPFICLYDHIITRKHIVVFFPTYYTANPGAPQNLNFCDVNEYIHHPQTGQVVCFKNTFNWFDENGENIFNLNKKLWLLWGYNNTNVTFPNATRIHIPTGVDYTFKAYFPAHSDISLTFNAIADTYGHLK